MTIKLKKDTPKNEQFSVGRISPADRILFQAMDKTNLLFTLASGNYGGSDRQISVKDEDNTSVVSVSIDTDHIRRLKEGTAYRLVNITSDNSTVIIAEGTFTFAEETGAMPTVEDTAVQEPRSKKRKES